MRPRKLALIALGTALALCPALPSAQETDLFGKLDRDRDGALSRQELESDAARHEDWIAVDRNRDGRISRTEFGTIPVARSGSGSAPSAAGGTRAP